MITITPMHPSPSVQSIIAENQAAIFKTIAEALALVAFIGAFLVWAA